jgi:hypothetical protein
VWYYCKIGKILFTMPNQFHASYNENQLKL